MREETTTPALAKGAVLAKAVSNKQSKMPTGTIIGKKQIIQLNSWNVKNISVIWVSLADLFPSPAASKICSSLAGAQLALKPTLESTSEIIATRAGILLYDEDELAKVQVKHPQFKIKALAPLTFVAANKSCVEVICSSIIISKKETQTAQEDMPDMQIRPCLAQKVALHLVGKKANKLISKINKRLKVYGDIKVDVHEYKDGKNYFKKAFDDFDTTGLAIFAIDNESDLAQIKKLIGAKLFLKMKLADSKDVWYTGNYARTSVVIMLSASQKSEKLNLLLDLFHAGIALNEQSLSK